MTPAKAYRHIIWDWNGTLFDDAWLSVSIINGMLERRRMPKLTLDTYREAFTTPVRDMYMALNFDFEKESYEALADEWFAEYERRRAACELHAHARAALDACAEAGLTQSILSMYRQDALEQIVRDFEIRDRFSRLTGLHDHLAGGKLEHGRRLLTEGELEPGFALMIGDTVHDHEVARAMGVDCILVSHGHQSRARLASCGSVILDRLDELWPHVHGLMRRA